MLMWFVELIKSLPRFCAWAVVFTLHMIIFFGDKIAWKLLRGERKGQYVRMGSCQKSGVCCKMIGIGFPRYWLKSRWIVKTIHWYMRFIHNFYPQGTTVDKMLVFECRNLTPDNSCGIYPFRPKICREFPFVTLSSHSKLYKGCGYWFIERNKLGTFEEKMAASEHEKNRRESRLKT